MPRYPRSWLLPLCLLLVIAALLVFSAESECPDNAWDGTPAIARVGSDCVYSLQLSTYLRDLSLGMGLSDQASEGDESRLGEFLSGRRRLVTEFGLENAAFATLAQDLALYQVAVTESPPPPDGEIMAVMGSNRERIRGLATLLELHELARNSDLEGFRDLLESPSVGQLIPVQSEEHVLALFEQAANTDLSGAAMGMEIHDALLESVGDEVYWTEVFSEQARWLVAVESLRLAVEGIKSPLPLGLQWQDHREKTWRSVNIELTDTAPESVTLSEVRQYMDGLHALERDLLTR